MYLELYSSMPVVLNLYQYYLKSQTSDHKFSQKLGRWGGGVNQASVFFESFPDNTTFS